MSNRDEDLSKIRQMLERKWPQRPYSYIGEWGVGLLIGGAVGVLISFFALIALVEQASAKLELAGRRSRVGIFDLLDPATFCFTFEGAMPWIFATVFILSFVALACGIIIGCLNGDG